jgi:hypothetical protein
VDGNVYVALSDAKIQAVAPGTPGAQFALGTFLKLDPKEGVDSSLLISPLASSVGTRRVQAAVRDVRIRTRGNDARECAAGVLPER